MKTKSLNKKRGISLIVLVITIIVIIILAVAVILSIANNNPIENSNKAKFQSDLKTMQEELELIKQKNYVESQGKDYGELDFDTLTGHEKYSGKFTINEGNLKYLPSKLSEKEQEWAKEIGITAGGYVLGSNSSDGVTIDDGGILNTNWYNSDTNTATVPEGVGTDVIIPEGVTCIGSIAFENCTLLTSVTIPSSVTSIGESAFSGCSSLTSITIPEGVTTISTGVFSGYTSLTSITIPKSVTIIGQESFKDCSALTSITIPEGVTSIGSVAFNGCTQLTSITIPKSVRSIGYSAFVECSSLTSIILKKGSPLAPANAENWAWGVDPSIVTKES